MAEYGNITNENEIQGMLDEAQKRARVRKATIDDVLEAVTDLDFFLNDKSKDNDGLEIQVFIGDYIANYRNNISPNHQEYVPQMTTAFTLRCNGNRTFTMINAERTAHLGYRFYIKKCPESVMLIDIAGAIGAGFNEYLFRERVKKEECQRMIVETQEIKSYAFKMD